MSFPTYSFNHKTDHVDTIAAADINELQDAIEEHRLINDATTSAEAGSVVRVALPADMAAAVLVRS